MDYIDTLLIMEDDLDENQEDGDLGEFGESSMIRDDNNDPPEQDSSREPTGDSTNNSTVSTPVWCVCGRRRPMPQEVENKCCKLKKCITLTLRFTKLCLDPDVLELCIKNRADIRNEHEENSTRAFRKAAY
ncbi:P2X purinoceptor 7-like, partial [Paramuricea clavata]